LATIDVDPDSPTYSQVVARTDLPQIGDELHHFGWNACSSCHGNSKLSRDYLLMPGANIEHQRYRCHRCQESQAPQGRFR